MTASPRFQPSSSESGSAAAEFVMILTPLLTTFTLCLGLIFTGMLRVQSIYLAQNLAQYCALADFEPSMLNQQLKSISPKWLKVDSLDCVDEGDVVQLRIITSVHQALIPAQTIEWFATSERQ